MLELNQIKQLLKNSLTLEQIASKSYMNCHCKGLHSLAFITEPFIIRMFYVDLDNGFLEQSDDFTETNELAIGYHSHRRMTSLVVNKGVVYHVLLGKLEDHNYLNKNNIKKNNIEQVNEWSYRSKILEGKSKVEKLRDKVDLISWVYHILREGESIELQDYLHTVQHASPFSSWFVIEREVNESHEDKFYNNSSEDKILESLKNTYLPMTTEKVYEILKQSDLLEILKDS